MKVMIHTLVLMAVCIAAAVSSVQPDSPPVQPAAVSR
jgi:hypothetical protein